MKNFFNLLAVVVVLSAPLQIVQAQKTVTGRITDMETNEPLPGATVSEVATGTHVIANENGIYSIQVSSETSRLEFSFTGYQSQTESIAGWSQVNVRLIKENATLGEVVVIGYGQQKKINLTGSVSTIQSKDLTTVPSSNVSEALIGKAPGLFTKQNQGVPGNDYSNLRIRGFGNPLILVDGIETSWTRLDPNEIESISILKDGAAAVYGARAGNGVILITTKRGKKGEPAITYNGSLTLQQAVVEPRILPSWQYAELLREGEFNSGIPYTYTEEEVQKFKSGTDPDYPNENWYRAALRRWAPMQSHTVSVDGGNEKVRYFMTAGYLDQAGIYRSGDLSFKRYNIRSNIDAKVTERISMSFDLSYRNELRTAPETPLTDLWTNLKSARPDWSATLPDSERGGSWGGFLSRSPVAQTQKRWTGFNDNLQRYLTGRLAFTYKVPKVDGLDINAVLNYATDYEYSKIQDKPFDVYSYNHESDQYEHRGINGANKLDEAFTQFTQLYPLVSLNYQNTFGAHSLKGLLLAESIDTRRTTTSAGRIDLLSVEIPYLFAGSSENITNNGSAFETGRVSYVGRLNYAFADKYLLEGTFRYDASHKFAPGKRWGFFPSVSAGWRLSEEPFIKNNLPWVSNLKIRGSYSKMGDDNVAAFKYLSGYEILRAVRSVYIFGTDAYQQIRTTGLPNPDITWLSMTNYNVGFEGSVKNGLIGFEVDFFYRLTDNIFGEPLENYPSTFGATLPQLNINSTTNRGFEALISHRNNIGRDLFYSVNTSVSLTKEMYKNWSESAYTDPDEIRIFQKSGNRTNRWFGYRTDGIFMSQEDIDKHEVNQDQANNTTLRPGDIRYIDLNGDGVIDWRDQAEIGRGTFPDLTYTFTLQLDYKGLGITALFQGASLFNYNIGDVMRSPLNNLDNAYDFHYKYRWQPDPDNRDVNVNPHARLPAVLGDGVGANSNNNVASDFWLKDGTYLRLRNLNISYALPFSWLSGAGFKQASVYVAGSNLFTLSKLGIYKHSLDPETSGVTQKFYPPVKVFSIGLNLKL